MALRVLKTIYSTPIIQELKLCHLQQLSGRRYLSESLKNKFTQFQVEDGVPVYLKGGFFDKFLFASTAALSAIGVADGLYSMLLMAFPKKA